MRLDLGVYRCHYCGSDRLRCSEWPVGSNHATEHDFAFLPEVESYIKENLEEFGEARLLFRCDACQRFFYLDIEPVGLDSSFLPFASEEPGFRVLIEFDSYGKAPQTVYIGGVPTTVIDYSQHFASRTQLPRHSGPFYPYPQGQYQLGVEVRGLSRGEQLFARFEVAAPIPPLFIDESRPDLDFYTFRVTRADPNAVQALGILDSLQPGNLQDFVHSKAAVVGLATLCKSLNDLRVAPSDRLARISHQASSARSSAAYRFFAWFEGQLREFVWETYRRIKTGEPSDPVEEGWWHAHFPERVRAKILQTAQSERRLKRSTAPTMPLDYSDFGNLFELLEHIWPELNRQINSDLDAARGHFRYLRAIRNSVAHARPLSHEDLMILQDHVHRFAELLEMESILDQLPAPFYPRPAIL